MSMCSCVDPEAECGYCSLRRTIQRKDTERKETLESMGKLVAEVQMLWAKVRELEKENQSLIDELNRGV